MNYFLLGTGKQGSALSYPSECSPGTSPVSGGQHGIIFPFPSAAGISSNWSSKGSNHPLSTLAPPSALAVKVSSAVSEVQDWWRDQLIVVDASDDESR